jgi:mono/diheme cytochrome c family protein
MKKAWICSITVVSIFFACSAFLQDYDLAKSIERGKEVYTANCMNCHNEDGSATPGMYPPLTTSDYLKKTADTLINVILEGQTGEVIVNDEKYNMEMMAQNYLSDEQIADVLNYVRNTWGNKMPAIMPAQVKALRK